MNFFNKIKNTLKYPKILQPSIISSIYKRKGDRFDLNNDRGIFNVTKLRSILDKMILNDIYDTVDKNMSSSNIGGRKGRNVRDHIFALNAVINDVKVEHEENVQYLS